MKPFVLTLRAIGAAFAFRLYIPVVAAGSILFVLLGIVTIWLTTYSEWWWLLLIPVVVLFSVFIAVAFVMFSLIRYVRPPQTKAQQQAVGSFIDRLQDIAEVVGTPKPLILFHVVRSIAAPSKDPYLANLVQNKELIGDFRDLQRSFEQ